MFFYKLLNMAVFLSLLFIVSCNNGNIKETYRNKNTGDKVIVLKIHAWEGYVLEHVTDFRKYIKKKLGVDLEINVTHTTGLNSFIKAIKTDDVHIISPANDLLFSLKRQKLILPIDASKIPKYKQINPTILNKKAHEVNGVIYAIPFNFGPYGIAYNKDKMLAPKTYKVLWGPKYKKRVTISGDYDTINIYMTALMLGISNKDIFNLNNEQLNKVEESLVYLCKNQVSEFWDSNLNPENHENFDIGMDWGIGAMQINDKYGKNWGFTIPIEGATGWIDTWAVSRNVIDENIKKIVYEFINYMIGSKVQAKIAKTTTYAPVNPYSGRYLNAKEKKRYYLTDPKFINKFILWKPLKQEVLLKYQQLWKRVKDAK